MNRTAKHYPIIHNGHRRCAHNCPGGSHCDLDSTVPHTLHICRDPHCPCHSRERYEGVLNGSH